MAGAYDHARWCDEPEDDDDDRPKNQPGHSGWECWGGDEDERPKNAPGRGSWEGWGDEDERPRNAPGRGSWQSWDGDEERPKNEPGRGSWEGWGDEDECPKKRPGRSSWRQRGNGDSWHDDDEWLSKHMWSQDDSWLSNSKWGPPEWPRRWDDDDDDDNDEDEDVPQRRRRRGDADDDLRQRLAEQSELVARLQRQMDQLQARPCLISKKKQNPQTLKALLKICTIVNLKGHHSGTCSQHLVSGTYHVMLVIVSCHSAAVR